MASAFSNDRSRYYIQAEVSEEIHRQFRNHPLTQGMTQREAASEAIKHALNSPKYITTEILDRLTCIESELRKGSSALGDLQRQLHETSGKLAGVETSLLRETEPATVPDEIPPASAAPPPSPGRPGEGRYDVVIEETRRREQGHRIFLDLRLRIVTGPFAGEWIRDTVLAVPGGERTATFRTAIGLGPEDSLLANPDPVTGKRVSVRLIRGIGPDGSPRMLCFDFLVIT